MCLDFKKFGLLSSSKKLRHLWTLTAMKVGTSISSSYKNSKTLDGELNISSKSFGFNPTTPLKVSKNHILLSLCLTMSSPMLRT